MKELKAYLPTHGDHVKEAGFKHVIPARRMIWYNGGGLRAFESALRGELEHVTSAFPVVCRRVSESFGKTEGNLVEPSTGSYGEILLDGEHLAESTTIGKLNTLAATMAASHDFCLS